MRAPLQQMRFAAHGYELPGGACPASRPYRGLEEFERDLHTHLHLKNNILFPQAMELDRSDSGGCSAAY